MRKRLTKTFAACVFSVVCMGAVYADTDKCSEKHNRADAHESIHMPIVQSEISGAHHEDYSERAALAERIRKANNAWLSRFGRSGMYDVSYDFVVLRPPPDKDGSLSEVERRSFRTVYDRGLDFLPASEHALFFLCTPPKETFSGELPDLGRIMICRWAPLAPAWLWPAASQYGIPSPLLPLLEVPYDYAHKIGTVDVMIDDETGLILRELFWRRADRKYDQKWFPCYMRTYEYEDGSTVPQVSLLFGGLQDLRVALPNNLEDWWQYAERMQEYRLPFRWYCEMVDGLFFVTRVEFLKYGADEIVRVHELSNIRVIKRSDTTEDLKALITSLQAYGM